VAVLGMTDRVFLTGARGLLGSEFAAQAAASGWPVRAVTRDDFDLARPESLAAAFRRDPCPLMIHCAAETNVDACEEDPDHADRCNRQAPLALARAVHEVGGRLVFVSSCGIFDGRKPTPYTEDDAPAPLTHYAASKAAAEDALLHDFPATLIVRVGWLFGGGPEQKKNFVAARCREAAGKSEVLSAGDKSGSPTWTRDVVGQVFALLDQGAAGIVHTANTGMASRAEYVAEILRLAGSPTTVRPVSSAAFPRRAPVPDNEALASIRLSEFGLTSRPWQEALKFYITDPLGGTSRK
jgi:dTDP-4-dehydrorhamnose reductase